MRKFKVGDYARPRIDSFVDDDRGHLFKGDKKYIINMINSEGQPGFITEQGTQDFWITERIGDSLDLVTEKELHSEKFDARVEDILDIKAADKKKV